jgi:hypothetical protein
VYTSLLGGYERLNEQPVAQQSQVPFVCLTDDPDLRSETWQVRQVSPLFPMDPGRSQRDFKLRPHVHLPEFDLSLYIDNAILLSRPPEEIFERYLPASGFCLPMHSFRESVLDEFLEVAKLGYDDQSRIFEQLNHYWLTCPKVLEERPYAGGILLRDHREPAVRTMLEIWYAHVLRYSRRDQLSINAAFRQAGLTPEVMDVNIYSSWFHSWPHLGGRIRDKSLFSPVVSVTPPVARVRQLEQQLAEAERLRKEVLSSDAWRIGRRLSESAKRHPRLIGSLLRVARPRTRKK